MLGLLSSCTILQPSRWPAGSGKILLTFDDGPTPGSEALLDVLKRQAVRVTFCYIGESVNQYPETARRAAAEGHVLANHTHHHRWDGLFRMGYLVAEIREADAALEQAAGDRTSSGLFRPPFGLVTPSVAGAMRETGKWSAYVTLFVDDSGADAPKAGRVMDRIKAALQKARGGAIVLHERRFVAGASGPGPDKSWLPGAVEELITWTREHGMEFVTYEDAPEIAQAKHAK